MKMKTYELTTTLSALLATTLLVIIFAASVNAQTNNDNNYKINVYKGCQKLDEIAMNSNQIEAYKALNSQELPMKALEQPLKEMEAKLALHEKELNALSGNLVEESDKNIKVNKAAIKKYEALAHKMELVVKAHQQDIQQLEKQAVLIKTAAKKFKNSVNPSLTKYKNQDVNISIGTQEKQSQCEA